MPGFFGSAAPYNTVTSPEEEQAAASGAAAAPSTSPGMSMFKSGDMPMQRILSAVMRSAASVQGQAQAAKVAREQEDAPPPVVTIKPGPHGPLVTVKDASIDLLNQTQDADVAEAATAPRKQVEQKLGQRLDASAQSAAVAPQSQPPADHPLEKAAASLEANGVAVLRPWDDEIRTATDSEESLALVGQKLGLPDAGRNAHAAWKQIQSGKVSAEVVTQRLANFAAQKLEKESHDLETSLAPFRAEDRATKAETDRQQQHARLMQSLTDQERERVYKHKTDIVKGTDWSLVPKDQVQATLEAENRSGVPFGDTEVQYALRKRQQDIAGDYKHFTEPKGPGVFSLGDFPTWEKAKATLPYASELTPEQNARGFAAWESAHRYAQRKAADDSMQQELRAARLDAIYQRLENATKEKPEKISPADINLLSASEIAGYDPSKVKDYDAVLRHKEGELRKEMQKAADQRSVHIADANAINSTPSFQRRFGWQRDLADLTAKAAIAKREHDQAAAELQIITAKRAERGGAPSTARSPQAPAVPYKPIANGQYSPEVERGISAHMQANRIGRAKAVEQLKAKGYLQ